MELLTNEQMAMADRLALAAGISGLVLMENAGAALAKQAQDMVPPGSTILVLCGPGNNGGDGFVAARLLLECGYNVKLALTCDLNKLKGDAQVMAKRWTGGFIDFNEQAVEGADLIIDAIFGAGLSRPLSNDWQGAGVIRAINNSNARVLAVDVPSGLNGTTGNASGLVIKADRTVTFFRKKPAHLLYPGAQLSGETVLADIGIPQSVLSEIDGPDIGRVDTFINAPRLWISKMPKLGPTAHKYTRGHAVAVSGPPHATGAARLAARAALRIGAGLATLASPKESVAVNAAHLTEVMIAPFEGTTGLANILKDKRKNALVIGPGCGVTDQTCEHVQTALYSGAAVVLDADALTSFEDKTEALKAAIGQIPFKERGVVLTPHEGEFARIFPAGKSMTPNSKLERARACAKFYQSIVVLKGPDTVIAHPDGKASINNNAPPWLATAGSGDVLSGMIGGLLAQGMPAFEAASASVWLHGACGVKIGRGLIASDLPKTLPCVLQELDHG